MLKDKKRQAAIDFYWANKEKILARLQAKRDANPDASKHRYLNNKEKLKASTKRWYLANQEKVKQIRFNYCARRNEINKLRRAENPARKLAENCRSRVYLMVKRFKPDKTYKTFDLIGCTPNFFVKFLEDKFKPGMTWQNYGSYWEIDHVRPLISFDLTNPEQLRAAFHFTNCQPLTAFENNSKHAKMPLLC